MYMYICIHIQIYHLFWYIYISYIYISTFISISKFIDRLILYISYNILCTLYIYIYIYTYCYHKHNIMYT